MGCFLTSLLQYINVDCLECNWNELKHKIEKANNFDSQLKAYDEYIRKLSEQISFYNVVIFTIVTQKILFISILIIVLPTTIYN